jgi:predicted ABC-type ATPase
VAGPLAAAIRSVVAGHAPLLLFLAGPNGAGKSTFFHAYLEPLGIPFVNTDTIAARVREASPRGASDIDQLAFERAEQLRDALLSARTSFCTETVFSDPHGAKLRYLARARDAGYAVLLNFIGLDTPELSLARVEARVRHGGHDVPDDKIRSRFQRTLANLRAALPVVDDAFLFDNSSARQPFRPVAVYSDGRLVEEYPPLPGWAIGLPR